MAEPDTSGTPHSVIGENTPTTGQPNPRRWLALVVLAALQAGLVLDDGVVNVALPALQRDLGFTTATLVWSNNAYALTFGALLLVGGVLADRYGRLRVFRIGTALFGAGSLACVFATHAGPFIGARVIQGLGAALASPAALALVTANFRDWQERNKALGWWGIAAGIGGVAGMSVAGVLIGLTSWHWAFLINVPAAVLLVVLIGRFTGESSDPSRGTVDWLGAALVSAALALLILGLLSSAHTGRLSDGVPMLIAGAVAFLAFVLAQIRRTNTMIPHGFFALRNRTVGFVVSLGMAGSFMAVFFALSLHLQNDLHFSPARTGIALTLQPIVSFFVFPVAAKFTFERGVRLVLPAGLLICAVAMFLLVRVGHGTSYWLTVAPSLVLLGIGTSFAFVSATAAAFGGDDEAAGLASAVIDAAQQVGTALGLAVFVAVSAWALATGSGFAVGISRAFGWAGALLTALAIFAWLRMETDSFRGDDGDGGPSHVP